MQKETQSAVRLTKEEWVNLVSREIVRETGLEPKEYFEQIDAGKIDCSNVAEPSIRMMLRLGGDTARQDILAAQENNK